MFLFFTNLLPVSINEPLLDSSWSSHPGWGPLPAFGKKSAWPILVAKPKTPESEWMTSTKFASVASNRYFSERDPNPGKAGSRPVPEIIFYITKSK